MQRMERMLEQLQRLLQGERQLLRQGQLALQG
jgi:hypothetical protein